MMNGSDERVRALRMLRIVLPEATTVAISFRDYLPSLPASLASAQKERREAQTVAADKCVEILLTRLGYSPERLKRGSGGERMWPTGVVGSLTHKGTVVLGAACSLDVFSALGIDLESWGTKDSELLDIAAPEGLPPVEPVSKAAALVFSAKEALFKAQYPLTKRVLEFEDLHLSWKLQSRGVITATADGLPGYFVRLTSAGEHIASAAVRLSGRT